MPRWSVNVKALKGTQARTTKGPEILNSLESHGTLWELDESRGLPSKNTTHKHGVPMQGLHSSWKPSILDGGGMPGPWVSILRTLLWILEGGTGPHSITVHHAFKRSSKCLLRNQWATDCILFFFHKRDLEPRDIKGLDQDHSES
jgi:hypothetical protein